MFVFYLNPGFIEKFFNGQESGKTKKQKAACAGFAQAGQMKRINGNIDLRFALRLCGGCKRFFICEKVIQLNADGQIGTILHLKQIPSQFFFNFLNPVADRVVVYGHFLCRILDRAEAVQISADGT